MNTVLEIVITQIEGARYLEVSGTTGKASTKKKKKSIKVLSLHLPHNFATFLFCMLELLK